MCPKIYPDNQKTPQNISRQPQQLAQNIPRQPGNKVLCAPTVTKYSRWSKNPPRTSPDGRKIIIIYAPTVANHPDNALRRPTKFPPNIPRRPDRMHQINPPPNRRKKHPMIHPPTTRNPPQTTPRQWEKNTPATAPHPPSITIPSSY